jgi:hypothetical protein
MRDFQKSKLYAWENAVVEPRTDLTIPFERAQLFVDGVWLSLGFQGPPRVEMIAPQATVTLLRAAVWQCGYPALLQRGLSYMN